MSRLEEIIKTKLEFNKWLKELSESEMLLLKDITMDYAEECIHASLHKASENREIFDDEGYFFQFVKPESITNPENIILL